MNSENNRGGAIAAANSVRTFSVQIVSLLTTLLDRIVLTGILIRSWGTEGYSDWVTIVSATSMMVIFEFGFQHYVGNQLVKCHARNYSASFQNILSWGMFVSLLLGVVLTALVLLIAGFVQLDDALGLFSTELVGVFIVLGIWNVARVSRGPLLQVYRGQGQYYRYLWADISATLSGIVLAIFAALMGAGPFAVAMIYLLTTIVLSVGVTILDLRKRFADLSIAPIRPGPAPVARGAHALRWYGTFFTVTNLMQNAPILMIAALGLSGPLLVTFTVQRTMVNFARTIAASISNAAGAELSVLAMQGNKAAFASGITLLARLNSTLAALAISGLLVFSKQLITLWTGKPELGSTAVLSLLLIPAAIVAPALALQQAAVLSDKLKLQSQAALINVIVGVGGGAVAGMYFGIVGIAFALAVGESIAIGGFAARHAAREFGISYRTVFLQTTMFFMPALAWSLVTAQLASSLPFGSSSVGDIARMAVWALIAGSPLLWLSISATMRKSIAERIRRKF